MLKINLISDATLETKTMTHDRCKTCGKKGLTRFQYGCHNSAYDAIRYCRYCNMREWLYFHKEGNTVEHSDGTTTTAKKVTRWM